MQAEQISEREVLHFLGWRGTPVEEALLSSNRVLTAREAPLLMPAKIVRRFPIAEDGSLSGTAFLPGGCDVKRMLASCHEAVLLAATLGAQSERMLLRAQAKDPQEALLVDAILSAAIEAVCDEAEQMLRNDLLRDRLYLTDRFSPGYGDMPIDQSREISAVLNTPIAIGMTVSSSGILMPRKSVTAIMGISRARVERRPSGCAGCPARATCAFSRNTKSELWQEADHV